MLEICATGPSSVSQIGVVVSVEPLTVIMLRNSIFYSFDMFGEKFDPKFFIEIQFQKSVTLKESEDLV